MGYTCVDGEIVIVPEQAVVVKIIFDLYLQGLSLGQIKSYLEIRGIKTAKDKDDWNTKTIRDMLKNEKYKGDTILQKTFTEDFMTGKKSKNIGQRSRYYVKDSHPAIVSAEVFDKVREEMTKRSRLVVQDDGTAETSGSKYNGKYLLGNLLVCGDCGELYRRRTERGKVLWRCETRIEKGKEKCPESPTINDKWMKEVLGELACESGIYEEDVIRNKVDRIQIIIKYIKICYKNGENAQISSQED